MQAHRDRTLTDEARLTFLKHLPKRVDQVARWARAFCRNGWDINGLALLHEDVQRLRDGAEQCGSEDTGKALATLDGLLGSFLEHETLPDAPATSRLAILLDHLAPPMAAPEPAPASPRRGAVLGSDRVEEPPAHYWRRWVADAAAPKARQSKAAAPVAVPDKSTPARTPSTRTAKAGKAAPAARPTEPTRSAPITKVGDQARTGASIYHLCDHGELAVELDQRLEALGYELELLEDGDELREVLGALAPDLVIVDATFAGEIESIGAVLRATRERTGARLPLLAIADADSVPIRLAARRAGADALLVKPRDAAEVTAKIRQLLDTARDAAYRILIVEDDRSQALFAESILRNAGMEAKVVLDPFEVLVAMEQFKPDLVLMDLYMPQCEGTELTALIRERDEFQHTPIVFLSGASEVDRQYEALEAGGDDFLSKPIRPKHLIAAVSNRVRRARTVQKRVSGPDPRDPVSGLYRRGYALERLGALLDAHDVRDRPGGVLYLDFEGVAALRDKLGLSGFEQLLSEAGALLVRHLRGRDFATRYGDGSIVVVCPERIDKALDSLAVELRSALVGHAFSVGGRPLRLRLAVGICPLRLGFADGQELLDAAARAAREARVSERGVGSYRPPQQQDAEQNAALLACMREAIEHDRFELLYQPIVAVQGGDESQYQTLLRLRDDNGRLHSAGEIIPLAEANELVLDLDRWTLAQALTTIESRQALGQPVRLFVNQAGGSMAAPDHAEWLAGQLHEHGVAGSALVIELTLEEVETCTDAVAAFCRTLVPLGVQFCLSRFEAGAVADLVLEKLPVDHLKLAPRYLAAARDGAVREELRKVIEAAHRRGQAVIAQRVEDAQVAAMLWMSGIDFIQGNLVQQAGSEMSFDFQAAVL